MPGHQGQSMNIQEYLEQDKEKFLSALAQGKTPERAVPVINEEIDRVIYRYNADCTDDELRTCASGMAEAVKAACALTDSVKEIKVWERTLPGAYEKKKESVITCAAAGGGCLGLGVLLAVLLHPFGVLLPSILSSVSFVAGAAVLFLAGKRWGKKDSTVYRPETEKQTESRIDEDKVYRYLKAAAMVMDRHLAELAEELHYLKLQGSATGDGELSDTEMTLFGDLLEALYCMDGEFALERLKGLSYYLHSRGIELADYSEQTSDCFDRMPGDTIHTIRPALLRDGEVLKKGLAITG